MIYAATGTVNMAQISRRSCRSCRRTSQPVLHVLLLVAFGIKAAVFPLSFWLPDSYPTRPGAGDRGVRRPAHQGRRLRDHPHPDAAVPRHELARPLLMVAALLTMVVGILGAVAQADIKRMLSFTLVSHIGYMLFGVALATAAGLGATIYYVAHHIVVQTTLFLAVGLDRAAWPAAPSLDRLGGLARPRRCSRCCSSSRR